VVLDNEAMLFLYTDGLTEAMDASHQQFGISRVLQQVKLAHADCQSLIPVDWFYQHLHY
jgi:serine phosphatase RsbU (regulator of sigma subunit)